MRRGVAKQAANRLAGPEAPQARLGGRWAGFSAEGRDECNGASPRNENERGAILILALVYIVIVSVSIAVLTTWATNNLNNTTHFTTSRSMDYSASSAAQVAINSIRYNPLLSNNQTLNASPPGSYCWGTSGPSVLDTDGITMAVYCSTLENLGSTATRTVTITACLSSELPALCAAAPFLQAVVVFNDYPPGGSAPLTQQCSQYCGAGASLASWDWGSKAGAASALKANAISITSTPPSHVAVGGTSYTPVATANSGDTVAITTSPTSVCQLVSSSVRFVGNGTCTINFNDPGNVNYLAAAQLQQTISVGLLANTINITSSAPSSATAGGATYAPTSSATSGDVVAVTSGSTAVCTVASGVVSFVASGTCTVNFNDPGNSTYGAASQVQQIFSVSAAAPGGADVQGVPSPQDNVPDNGDIIRYTYSTVMSASSLLGTFNGSSTPVFVQLTRASGNPTSLQVCSTSACGSGAVYGLGTVSLGDTTSGYRYDSSTSNVIYINGTLLMSTVSGESVVTLTLGSLYSATAPSAVTTPSTTTLAWNPSASAKSTGGVACSTSPVTESGSPKLNF